MSLDRTALTYSKKTVEQLDLAVYVQKAKCKSSLQPKGSRVMLCLFCNSI